MNFHNIYNNLLSLTNLQLVQFCDSLDELERSMARMRDFLTELDNPERHLKFIHVTGTSGKGSVCNMMHEILRVQGQKVGTYTSPHTTSYLERFRVGDQLIDPELLTKCMREVMDAYEKFLHRGEVMSFFELSTCLALYAFVKAGMKWCVLEVGCGGRFDATNAIPTPKIAIITNVDKDHTDILGNSLAQIAYEKAGIIKRGGTAICGELRPQLRKIFKNEAVKNNAALFFVTESQDQFLSDKQSLHQKRNAALAVRAARELDIDDAVIERALRNLRRLPCRFETIERKPRIILDGAHSPAKIKALTRELKRLGKPLRILFGCSASKDAAEMIKLLAPLATSITTTRFKSSFRKAANPALLEKIVPSRKRAGYFLDAAQALEHVKKLKKGDEVIVITGSLFLTGELRALWIPEADILKNRSSFR